MEADQLGRLRDILQAARLMASYLKDATETGFLANSEKPGEPLNPARGEPVRHVVTGR
jgi:hypothetical protein